MKKQYLILSVLIGFLFLFNACNKGKEDICDPNQVCYTEEPDELYIKLELSSSPSNAIEITLYEGYFEDGEILDQYTSYDSELYYLMPVGKRYTATAKYIQDGKEIVVIDSDRLKAISYQNCEETCYDWEDEIVLDLKLAD